jgi:transposase
MLQAVRDACKFDPKASDYALSEQIESLDDLVGHDDARALFGKTYDGRGLEGLRRFEAGGSVSYPLRVQEEELSAYVRESLPRSAREMAVFLHQGFGVVHESRSGLIAFLHRLGLDYKKPQTSGRGLDVEAQRAVIEDYEKLPNSLDPDEVVLFADCIHPRRQPRAVGRWAPSRDRPAVAQTAGRECLKILGALDLRTGKTAIVEVKSVSSASVIRLLEVAEAKHPQATAIHAFLDSAPAHHAVLGQQWLAQPNRKIKLHLIPAYCPHLNPIQRLWGLMYNYLADNKYWRDYRAFADYVLRFLREQVPRHWRMFADSVTDNFRLTNPTEFRVLT